jgi:hypothetical protein
MDHNNIDFHTWSRIRNISFKTHFDLPIILDVDNRIKHSPKFPVNKYLTFKCVMMHLNVLPMDVIKYIMYMIIDSDKIHQRLLISEFVLSILDVQSLNIQMPKKCGLTFEEAHEGTLMKMFEISAEPMKFYKQSTMDKYYFKPEFVAQYKLQCDSQNCTCISCDSYKCTVINNVGICANCYRKLTSWEKKKFVNKFDNCGYFDLNNVYKNFKELKEITSYKYFEYIGDNNIKYFTFVSKQTQIDRKNYKVYIKKLIEEEKEMHYKQFQLIDDNYKKSSVVIKRSKTYMNKLYQLNDIYKHFTVLKSMHYYTIITRIYSAYGKSGPRHKKNNLDELKKELTEIKKLTRQYNEVLFKFDDVKNNLYDDGVTKKVENKFMLKHMKGKKRIDETIWKRNNIKNKVKGNKYGNR